MDLKEFEAVFPEVVQVLSTKYCDPEFQSATKWSKKALEYIIPAGKKDTPMLLIEAFKAFAPKEALTKENLHLAAILGWCLELLKGYWFIFDDYSNDSETRRGKPCWHKNEYVNILSLVDGLSFGNAVFVLLEEYFVNKDYYRTLVDIFVKVPHQTYAAKTLKKLASKTEGKINFDHYTKANLDTVHKYTTTKFSTVLPVSLAMLLAGCSESRIKKVEPLLTIFGQHVQIQYDYYTCFEANGSYASSDIEAGTYCWTIVTAFELASAAQKKILVENYGKEDKNQIAKVKAVYDELNMHKAYADYKTKALKDIDKMIENLKNDMPMHISNVLYERFKQHEK